MTEHESMLSTTGRIRRSEMLQELTAAMRLHHDRRRRRRRLLATAAAVAAAAAVPAIALLSGRSPTTTEETAVSAPAETPAPAPAPLLDQPRRARIELVHTKPDILERYAATPISTAVRLDDGALLTTLASLDRRAGLVRDETGLRLTRDVTNAALAARGSSL